MYADPTQCCYDVSVAVFPAYTYPCFYEAQPMLSIAVVPASSLNFFMSFAYADSETRASQVTLTSKPLTS